MFFNKKPHELRLQILNPAGMTPEDAIFAELLAKYPPRTNLQPGDLCKLIRVPAWLSGQGPFPNIWEVRAVYSRYQHALHEIVQSNAGMLDWAVAQIETSRALLNRHLPQYRWREPLVYAHAFPHGSWPSSAEWFPEDCLHRTVLRAPTEDWQPILDEFSTPFLGYDEKHFGMGVVLDLAPDIYGDQRQKVRPLSFEENAFHRACLLGLEEECMVPAADDFMPHDPENYFEIFAD